MRTLRRILLVSSGALAVGLGSSRAGAQNDITPHLPNVLLLLDTSGSMEMMVPPDPTDGTGVRLISPEKLQTVDNINHPHAACVIDPTAIAGQYTGEMNRWAQLVTVLTGTIPSGQGASFGCEAVDRSSAPFLNEYQIDNINPYDYKYMYPFHRIYSNGCTVGAANIQHDYDWSQWPNNAFDFHTKDGTCQGNHGNGSNCCTWSGQYNDGLLDSFAGLVRFGLMTFDTLPGPNTGIQSVHPPKADAADGNAGNWSYFHGWQSYNGGNPVYPGPPAAGRPAMCSQDRFMEVGARNQAAPPWEGPLIPFGDPANDSGNGNTNQNIQWAILAMRPYGATPLAGMLDDAREFLFHDDTTLPGGGPNQNQDFGPYHDPYWQNGCRKTFIILLTDGEPNLDLRGPTGQCEYAGNPQGHCPYQLPEDIIYDLRTNPPKAPQSVETYVVGFAMSNPKALQALGKTSCSQVDGSVNSNDCTAANLTANPGLKPCCELQKLAYQGTNIHQNAYFADNPGQLKAALANILSQIVGTSTDRTSPVYAAAGNANAQGAQFSATPASSYHFAASFNVTSSASSGPAENGAAGGLWTGGLKRERYICSNGSPQAVPVTPSSGDDFAANLDSNDPLHPRQIFTVIGADAGGGKINSDNSIRPNLPADDHFGTYSWDTGANPMALTSESTFPANMGNYYAAFDIKHDYKPCKDAFGDPAKIEGVCATDLMNYEVGRTNALPPNLSPAISRDPASSYCNGRQCSKLGAVYHSTPVVVGPPHELIRDDSYILYASQGSSAKEPQVLYTATIDGQLHAFKVQASDPSDPFTVDTKVNNELWTFFPPAVQKRLLPNYNTGGAQLLDGTPVIADVPGQTALGASRAIFQRTAGSTVNWHRVLVAAGGPGGSFYYALDITNPLAPQFLWQLSTDDHGDGLFGDITPTPAIGTVAIDINSVRTQVPVAILSGGTGTLAHNCPHPPPTPDRSGIVLNDINNPNVRDANGIIFNLNGFQAPPLRCWGSKGNDTDITGNSLTIVRLDSGEVLAHFIGYNYLGAIGDNHAGGNADHNHSPNAYPADFTAPIVGVPVAYPGQTGQVTEKIYVGDADGQLWRVDVTDPNPAHWKVQLAWDAYVDASSSVRESIQLAPVLSRDPIGNTVIMMATGDQNQLTSQSTDNRVWSITETPILRNTSQNWFIRFAQGDRRVTGPMEVFNDVLYFATYVPQSGPNVCSDGFGSVWAVDYRRPDPSKSPYAGIPVGEFPTNPPQNPAPLFLDGCVNANGNCSGGVIFGVSVAETPSCNTSQVNTDGYYGANTQVTNVGQAEYRVMWQTGGGSGINPNGVVRNEVGVSKMQNMTVPAPGQSTRIDSWASLVE